MFETMAVMKTERHWKKTRKFF